MGYNTDFEGRVIISPPLSAAEVAYLKNFSRTRHVKRTQSPYYVDPSYSCEPDVIDFNQPHDDKPNSFHCDWAPWEDGTALEWNGNEKFYEATAWMIYLIEHFLRPDCHAAGHVPGMVGGHICNGLIAAQGEDPADRWNLIVENNQVRVEKPGRP